jgi:hypothetical protein
MPLIQGTGDFGIIPGLLRSALVGHDFGKRLMIPEFLLGDDHWHGFEIAAARRLFEPSGERTERVAAIRKVHRRCYFSLGLGSREPCSHT